jgi:hypothetical protein
MHDYCLRSGGSVSWRYNLQIERTNKFGMKEKTVIHIDALPESMKRQGWRLSSENGKRPKKQRK